MAPAINLNAPVSLVTTVPYNELISTTVGGNFDVLDCARGLQLDLYNLNQNNYTASAYQTAFSTLQKFYADHPGGRSSTIVFENFGNQATKAVPSDETAYPWRDARGYM